MSDQPHKPRRPWQRDELLMAMNLYCRLPFGRMHKGNPDVIRLAGALGRTPDSVAMKLTNLASLDPSHRRRGVRGLSGASAADRAVWEEFHADWARLAAESEQLIRSALPGEQRRSAPDRDLRGPSSPFLGETSAPRTVQVRLAQSFFRRAVLASYGGRCCITGNPVRQLLSASHIAPWSTHPHLRVNPTNGLCLARTHDAAFDRGLITLDADCRLLLSPRLLRHLPHEQLDSDFKRYEGRPIRLPERFLPDPDHLRLHRETVFY